MRRHDRLLVGSSERCLWTSVDHLEIPSIQLKGTVRARLLTLHILHLAEKKLALMWWVNCSVEASCTAVVGLGCYRLSRALTFDNPRELPWSSVVRSCLSVDYPIIVMIRDSTGFSAPAIWQGYLQQKTAPEISNPRYRPWPAGEMCRKNWRRSSMTYSIRAQSRHQTNVSFPLPLGHDHCKATGAFWLIIPKQTTKVNYQMDPSQVRLTWISIRASIEFSSFWLRSQASSAFYDWSLQRKIAFYVLQQIDRLSMIVAGSDFS